MSVGRRAIRNLGAPLFKGRGEKELMKMMRDLGRRPRKNWPLKSRDKSIL